MDAFLISLASLLSFFLIIVSLPFVYAAWRRATNRGVELEIWQVMRRLRISPGVMARTDAKLAHAVRRCVLCPSLDACGQWLASDRTEGIAEFCPNGAVLERATSPRTSAAA